MITPVGSDLTSGEYGSLERFSREVFLSLRFLLSLVLKHVVFVIVCTYDN